MVCAKLEDNAFLIADSLLKNKISQALKIYYDLRINKEEPVRLISLIATQFRFMMQVQFLMAKNYSYDEIANELKTKPFRVKKNGESLILIKRSGLLNIMEYLYQMDMQIKSGEKDPYIIFELFIINFNQIKNGEIKLKD